MSADLRRHIAYFGPREKVYANSSKAEVPNMPPNWRRVLSQSYPFPIVGPFGNVYSDMEHALIAFRYMYASSCPHYSELFRMEHGLFAKSKTCRRFGSSNGLSLLQTDPDDRVWSIVKDKCMFDIVYQRICRDVKYRSILRELVRRRYLPVYHVRTADESTYWGATMDKTLLKYTNKPAPITDKTIDDLAEAAEIANFETDPSKLLVGKNRLGEIMVHAYNIYREVYDIGVTVRNVVPGDSLYIMPGTHATPIHPEAVMDHVKRSRELAVAAKQERASAAKRQCTKPSSEQVTNNNNDQEQMPTKSNEEFIDEMLDCDEDDDACVYLSLEDFL